VTSDVTPHHLLLDETFIAREGICDANYKMKPPLRTGNDRLALVMGLQTGVIDCIATDHAPHSAAEKSTILKRRLLESLVWKLLFSHL